MSQASAKRSNSSAVVARPNDTRSAHAASASGTPIARSTPLGLTFPDEQADPAETAKPARSILTPGWKGETQVMQMDLAGFAVSAGSACSSGKVRSSGVLRAMGYSDADAGCAIRVSFGGATTPEELDRFADAWLTARARWQSRQGR